MKLDRKLEPPANEQLRICVIRLDDDAHHSDDNSLSKVGKASAEAAERHHWSRSMVESGAAEWALGCFILASGSDLTNAILYKENVRPMHSASTIRA